MKKRMPKILLGLFIVFSFIVIFIFLIYAVKAVLLSSNSNIVLGTNNHILFGILWFGVVLPLTLYAALADHEKIRMESKKRLEENKKRLESHKRMAEYRKKQQALAKLNNTIFLDTSTIIGGGIDFLKRTSKVANLFITDIVLQELDGLKNAEGDTGYKAREIYRQLAPATTKELYELPNRTELKRDDTLFEMTLPSGLVFYTIHRNKYKTRDINDSKIIEVANDYKGTLATIDIAQSIRAKSVGCKVVRLMLKESTERSSNSPRSWGNVESDGIGSGLSSSDSPYTDPSFMGASWSYYNND